MKSYLLIFCVALLFSTQAFSQSQSYKDKVVRIATLTVSEERKQLMVENAIERFLWLKNKHSYAFWNEFTYEMRKTTVSEFGEVTIPVYYKYFSESELDTFIEGISLPRDKLELRHQLLLQKLSSNFTKFNQEMYDAGSNWGAKKAEAIIVKLNSKGL